MEHVVLMCTQSQSKLRRDTELLSWQWALTGEAVPLWCPILFCSRMGVAVQWSRLVTYFRAMTSFQCTVLFKCSLLLSSSHRKVDSHIQGLIVYILCIYI